MPTPLNILVVHNHYQQRGGEDSVFETECAMLEAAGNTVIRYEKHNDEIGNQRLAASGQRLGEEKALGPRDEVLARQDGRNESPTSKLRPRAYGLKPFRAFRVFRSSITLFCKTIWNRTTYREITALIREYKPDVIHCHNTFPLISPSVYWAAAKQGVPVVQTLHNYRLVCPGAYLFRDRRICEDCLGRSPLRGVIHRCYRGSFAASFTVAAMLMVHRLLGTYRNKVTTYIALTEFGRRKFLESRLCDPSKVVVKPNAVAAPAEAATAEGLAASGQRLGAEDAQGSGFRVQDQRLAASGQRLGSEGAQGSGFRVKSEEQRLAAPTAQVLGTRYQVLANTATTEEGVATKRHQKPQKETSSHTEALAASATAEAVPQVLGTRYQVLANTKATPKDNPEALAPSTYPLVPEHCCGRPATVLYVGRLSPEKGVDILIAAWKLFLAQSNQQPTTSSLDQQEDRNDSPASQLVPSTYPLVPSPSPAATLVPSTYHLVPKAQPRLHIIGDGPERAKLQCMAEGHSEIIFLGSIPHERISSHMRSATALVLPTRCYEMFAITPLEAMQIGLPVILSDSAATGSLVEDDATGFTFRSGSVESLAEALAKALADPDRLAELGRQAQARFLAGDCPPERNVAALCRVYREALGTRY